MTANSIPTYLTQLRQALKGSDAAIIQDALFDAEDHLRTALEVVRTDQPGLPEGEAIQNIITEYGSPEEIAAAYREVEAYTRPAFARSRSAPKSNPFSRFFRVYADPQSWGALVYMLISILTGTLYFSWVFVGLSSSLIFALFIFGLPLVAFFILSIRGLALVEGRIVEALLGVRMPRRTIFSHPNLNWRQRLVSQLSDWGTWKMMAYLILQGLLGTLYFTLFVLLIATALLFIGMPVISSMGLPVATINDQLYFAPIAAFPFTIAFGILLTTVTMHLAKWIGGLHGRFAKFMLVGE